MTTRTNLIDELAQFPALTDDEQGLLYVARKNAERIGQIEKHEDKAEAAAVYEELGFRLDRLKRKIEGSKVAVFNRRTMRPMVPKLALSQVVI